MLSLQVKVKFSNSNPRRTIRSNLAFEEERRYLMYFCNFHTEKATDALFNLSNPEKVKIILMD